MQQLWKPENQNAETGYVYNVQNSFVWRFGNVMCTEVHVQLVVMALETSTILIKWLSIYIIFVLFDNHLVSSLLSIASDCMSAVLFFFFLSSVVSYVGRFTI